MISYRELKLNEICRELFGEFIRHQNVTKCIRRENNKWVIKDDPFVDDRTENDYKVLIEDLKNTINNNGFVYAAFYKGSLKGFVSIEFPLFGGAHKYIDLPNIYVSEDMRGQGIGKALFVEAKKQAKKRGAEKLYISAHSAVESQKFYKAMGCVEAELYDKRHIEKEPYDCQLECKV